ncbi:hypothetical protein MtrunA17_Chr7g0265801 [Medicago truncatula]|uniref:DUF868 family protein n=1 Tax=Medicago truncatula TaxID=3880 RepID=G7L506_MEDTR|nr:uncharacterized protein LOC11432960 [Medicago truncatula]AES81973.1 DUF868 family protein [Medicago truncatula]RHN48627.1 hypothetical protein MtrunA17_Chr7g0265801 [Medicago truncatula]
MRGITSCYNEHAIRVSDLYCSRPSNSIIPKLNNLSIQNSVTCIYKLNFISIQQQFLITLTWTKKLIGQGFIINITSDSDYVNVFSKFNGNPRLLLKQNKGTDTFQYQNFEVKVLWDLSDAKYDEGPEPVNGFYVMVLVNSELGLFLGDKEEDSLENLEDKKNHDAKFSMVSRSERFYGTSVYATKAKFSETGISHDILIKCGVEEEGSTSKSHMLCLFMDKKIVFKVKRLKWNFRGNQTIFVDGLVVDMMWDLHDWIFNPSNIDSVSAVFMFRTRSGLNSRLWLEEKNLQKQKEQDRIGFSLLICGCKNPD